jgi:hypothetical protein
VDLYSTAALVVSSTTPFSDRTHLVADRNYLIDFLDMVVAMPFLKRLFCVTFFDGLPTGKHSFWRYMKRVVREECDDGGCVVLVERLVILLTPLANMLGYLWICRVFNCLLPMS